MSAHHIGIQHPRVPSELLCQESFKTLSRLHLISEFKPWLEYTREYVRRRVNSPFLLLWDCICFGAPLNTLLQLLGSPTPRYLSVSADEFDFNVSIAQREQLFSNFIQRVQTLESQGRLSYGEVLRVDDFTSGINAGYLRILKTINRILFALQTEHPGIFSLPHGSAARRSSLIEQLVIAERSHNSKLIQTADSAAKLYEDPEAAHPSLEGFIVNCSRLVPYHEHVLKALSQVDVIENWQHIFAFHNKVFFTRMNSAYRSICANYLTFENFLNRQNSRAREDAKIILRNLSEIISRFSDYSSHLQAILDVSSPTEHESYDGLCIMSLESATISDSLVEVGRELRTMWCFNNLRPRLGSQTLLDEDALGNILHDDCMLVDPASGQHYSVFLFEKMLICCTDHRRSDSIDLGHVRYPVKPWEIGPALAEQYPLVIMLSIPTDSLKLLHCIDTAIFEISWGSKSECSIIFYPIIHRQYTQWTTLLEPFVSRVSHSTSVPRYLEDSDGVSVYSGVSLLPTEDEIFGIKSVIARPWSLIGRKGNRSESSSMIGVETSDKASILSPNLLPTLFVNDLPRSPLHLSFVPEDGIPSLHHLTESPTEYEPAEGGHLLNNGYADSISFPDLTQHIVKEGYYPIAHGGFSDVWKATWTKKDGTMQVAVKVIRNTINEGAAKEKLVQRLHQELSIWKGLLHPHILELCGTVTGYGPYVSMVCPWLKNGSLTKYLERCGDILTVGDRLRLISEIASGLNYLHSRPVVHGDLTGSNVLIDDDLHARLCDFGLSTLIMEECQDDNVSVQSVYTSHLGGSVRWADAYLFRAFDENAVPVIGTSSDIYSFGSVMLEVLSGRMPYHYLRTDAQVVIQLHQGIKPRRPSASFVDDAQWDLIQMCWKELPEERPTSSQVLKISKDLFERWIQSEAR
ncbi:Tyrosine-protein kinase isoform SRK4 [Psilocybe cubensis]|uniref:Protein kinase domain-containing protein n=2 Tax=Psilocybe cubensis TaxID=181762 RepID=A0A8H7XSC8_PSICU|nr:Tyrosine-protein kinase isoform SRK4 [Psilocybe cubensis]KAH9480786.1 Tyrosine-protein kinase isoform SRK4 [Psilocybe cubensis]